jgi:hypothetical protein
LNSEIALYSVCKLKGLNESEIQLAFKQAGISDTESTKVNPNLEATHSKIETKKNQTHIRTTIWSRIFKWIKNLLVAGCLAFTAYKILIRVRNFPKKIHYLQENKEIIYFENGIKKYIFPNKAKSQANADKMLIVNQQLNEAIKEMKSSINSLKITVEGMNTVVMQISAQKVNCKSCF